MLSFAMLVVVVVWAIAAFPLMGEHEAGFPVRQQRSWPNGLADLLNSGGRVYGYFVNWNDYLFFAGDTEDFNEFLERYAKLEAKSLKLVLHPGQGKTRTVRGDSIRFDWKVTTPQLTVELWVGGQVQLPQLKIPPNVEVGSKQGKEWTDGKAKIVFTVEGGDGDAPFSAIISVSNLADEAMWFPTPFVMPLCGDDNTNNIRVCDRSGRELEMVGAHKDFPRRPVTEVPAHSCKAWKFCLDDYFPGLRKTGKYKVALWYFSDDTDASTWKGRVEMEPILVEKGT